MTKTDRDCVTAMTESLMQLESAHDAARIAGDSAEMVRLHAAIGELADAIADLEGL